MWTPNSALLAAEVELLDQAQYLEIHEGGGTWAIQTSVTIGAVGNAAWTFTAPVVVNDISGHVVLGKTLWVDAGARLLLSGSQRVGPGAAIQVLGNVVNPATIEIGSYGRVVIDAGGTLLASAGSTVDIAGQMRFESGASWQLLAGARGTVDGGGMLYLLGATANPALLVLQQYAQAVFWATTECQFLANSLLTVMPGATVNVQGQLNVLGPAAISGAATLTSDATLTASGTQGHNAKIILGPNSELNFSGGSLTGFPVIPGLIAFSADVGIDKSLTIVNGAILHVSQGAQVQLDANSTVTNAATTTRTGPEIRQGDTASTGLRVATGPDSDIFINAEAVDYLLIPTLTADRTWKLVPPSHTLEFEIAQSASGQGANLQVMFGTTPMGLFLNDGGRFAATVKYQWDGKTWRVKAYTEPAITLGGGSALHMPN
jgi:hypothetical protein